MKERTEHQILKFVGGAAPVFIIPHKKLKTNDKITLWHEQIEIKLFYSSGTELVIGNRIYVSEKGDIFVINSCEPHSTSVNFAEGDYHLIHIDTAKLFAVPGSKAASDIADICSGAVIFNNLIRGNAVVKGLIEELVSDYTKKTDHSDLRTYGLVCLLLEELMKSETSAEKGKLSHKNAVEYTRKLSPAILMINKNYTEKLSLSELASACGLSGKYFCRIFRQITGQTAVTYINTLRINKAAIMLKTTDFTISETAEKCGFSDTGYFCRIFIRLKGISPLQFRKKTDS